MPPFQKMFRVCTLSCFILVLAGCSKQHGDVAPESLPDNAVKKNGGSESAQLPTAESHHRVTFYTVDHYDEARDPAADLAEAVQRAGKEKKRILIQVGGDWCSWCLRMSNFMESNEVVRNTITDNFVVMKVIYTDKQKNESFLSQYPKANAYPHIYVLDSDGTFLHSQGTAELEEGKGYNQEAYRKFLVAWKPER